MEPRHEARDFVRGHGLVTNPPAWRALEAAVAEDQSGYLLGASEAIAFYDRFTAPAVSTAKVLGTRAPTSSSRRS